jgi:hypothetical protein
MSDSCFLFLYYSDSDQTSNPVYCHPIPDNREQSRVSPAVPLQVVESRAPIPTLPGNESTSKLELADNRLLLGAYSKVKSGLVTSLGIYPGSYISQ